MVFQRIILALALLLAFTLGMSGYAFDQGVAPKTRLDVASSHMTMPGKCDPCGKGHARMSACSVVCSGTMLPLPVAIQLAASVSGTRYHQWPDRQVSGSTISPDPYPPKSTILI
jgi:hypothetical protein